MFQGQLELLVPAIVIEEFERNRPRAEAAVTTSVLDRFRQLRQDLHEYGGEDRMDWLEEMSHRVPMVSSGTLQNFSEISELLRNGTRLEPSATQIEGAIRRGLAKQAPFHLNKNGTSDALIIEMYAAAVRDRVGTDDVHCFVTSNYANFSVPNGDRREPHADLVAMFEPARSEYLYGVEGLDKALVRHLGAAFTEEADEAESLQEEPRTLAEILEAEREFFDKLWYGRRLILNERIELGEEERPPDELDRRAKEAMRAIESGTAPTMSGRGTTGAGDL
jgi:hypothetical protein